MKNIKNKTLKICSLKPVTGYNRDGYCHPTIGDYGSHLICAKMDKRFLDYSASRGNNLRSVVKEGENWCLCQNRYYEAYKAKKAPKVIKNATSNKLKSHIKNIFTKKFKGGKLLPKLRKLLKENKKHIYKLYDPQYKRILAMEEGIHQKKNKTKKDKINAAKMKKARFNVLRLYRKNKDKKGCNNFTKDMKYLDTKYNLGNTKNIC